MDRGMAAKHEEYVKHSDYIILQNQKKKLIELLAFSRPLLNDQDGPTAHAIDSYLDELLKEGN